MRLRRNDGERPAALTATNCIGSTGTAPTRESAYTSWTRLGVDAHHTEVDLCAGVELRPRRRRRSTHHPVPVADLRPPFPGEVGGSAVPGRAASQRLNRVLG